MVSDTFVLKKIQAMSEMEQGPFSLVGDQPAILSMCRTDFCYAVQEKFNCTSILRNVKEGGSFSSGRGGYLAAEKKYSTKLPSGVELSVWIDDLTRHKVDAVVNAANEDLQHGGGLAQALCLAGGPEIDKESANIIKRQGKVKTGDAVLTCAGKLPCKAIIHAVGPSIPSNPMAWEIENAAPLLFKAIHSILDIVYKEKFTSVAIPALSSGIFNFPRDRCADVIVEGIKKYCEHPVFHDRHLEIRLVNFDEPSVREMERAVREKFDRPSTSGSYSTALQKGTSGSSRNTLEFGPVRLELKEGAIEGQQVEVIVNTISPDLNLSMGLISNAILKNAGNKIQDEINRAKYTKNSSLVYVTKGYNLKCDSVYHTVCPHRNQNKSGEILFNAITECLRKASNGYRSIAFPAIGTGNLGYNKSDVAGIMVKAVAEFAKKIQKKLDVYFVVFPKDTEMMQAFEKEMKKFRGASHSTSEAHSLTMSWSPSASKQATHETPCVEFQSDSTEALREAKMWTLRMLNLHESITIQNNHVIYFGQKEHEDLLSLQTLLGVHIEDFFSREKSGLTIQGNAFDVSCAAFKVEAMLCKAQQEFARAEERDILYSVVRWSCKDQPWIQTPVISGALEKAFLAGKEKLRTPLSKEEYFRKEAKKAFGSFANHVIKAEKLENIALQQLFDKHKQRVKDQPRRLFQRVSAQFCNLICRVGFQADFAPPSEQRYGNGIYFSESVEGALKLWNDQDLEEYVYIIQAQVLTGNSTIGSPELILPPPLGDDPLQRYDSLCDMKETYVIANGLQALPEYLIICSNSSF
ncbi:hypothetical protein DNTS_016445 [Danionella cerebrum]|uniref:Uncharacterized protein n=1 Tax=Danionella cerebrum TaxID=2873325 RepID=A0A553N5L3_9TELE|nr:hypothetical protein DNTS_016445 [Danionella translucida]